MKPLILALGILAFWTGSAAADVQAPAPAPDPAGARQQLVLDLTCLLPTNGPAVARGVLEVRLYEYDPRKASGAAAEIGRVSLAGIAHRAGEETVQRFPCAGETAARKAYYITAVVFPEGAPAGGSGIYFIDGFQPVLAAGDRESLTVTLAPVDADAGPSN